MDIAKQQTEGGLAVGQREAKELELKAQGLLESIHLHLDRLKKIEDINMPIAFQQMAELSKTWELYMEKLELIAKAKKILGRE